MNYIQSEPIYDKMVNVSSTAQKECEYCQGTGWAIQFIKPCEKCNGIGKKP